MNNEDLRNDIVEECKSAIKRRELLTGELLSILIGLEVYLESEGIELEIKSNNYDILFVNTSSWEIMNGIAKHFGGKLDKRYSPVLEAAYMTVLVSDNIRIVSDESRLASEIKKEVVKKEFTDVIVDKNIAWFPGEKSE